MLDIIKILENGGVGVIPTDTLYGLVAQALNKQAVSRVYRLKQRSVHKPFIILISSYEDLAVFGIKMDRNTESLLKKYWPGPVSIILLSTLEKFRYLDRGSEGLAFRLPKKKKLLEILKKTGPLIAPSANPENKPPAKNIGVARKYFGDKVDFYLSGGTLNSKPSSLIRIKGENIEILRK